MKDRNKNNKEMNDKSFLRRLAVCVLAISLLCGLLTGCGGAGREITRD